jgi:hypothetical protein
MIHAIAVINPSLFEGWSTSVEESKSRGKAVIHSDIPVHCEQAPARGYFFNPHDPEQLLEHLLDLRSGYAPETEMRQRVEAKAQFPHRLAKFRHAFEDLVLEARAQNAAR